MKSPKFFCIPVAIVLLLSPALRAGGVLSTELLKKHVERFNADDKELYSNIPNAKAFEFLAPNVPLFECPDEDIVRTYYYRWWSYRKHVKKTADGYVITEFLPKVPWSRKHNTICCPAAHHFYEGRWLRDPKYLNDYAIFWFRKGGAPRQYSFWAADAYWAHYMVHHDKAFITDLLDDLVNNYRQWEKSRLMTDGLFWQYADRDGMEAAVAGGAGKRATINSYMYGDAKAIAQIAKLAGKGDVAGEFSAKAAGLKKLVQTRLWHAEHKFFETLRLSPFDLVNPKHSEDGWFVLRLFWTDRERRGTKEWIQYDFAKPVTLDAAEVYWYASGHYIHLPASWRILYRDGEQFKPVSNTTPYPVARDKYNKVAFKPVTTTAIRLQVQSARGKTAGLFEWRVLGGGKNLAPSAKPSTSFPVRRGRWGNPIKTLNDGEGKSKEAALVNARELHGYTPWYFNLPDAGEGYEVAWKQLMDPKGFYAPYGPTTAEQRHPGFKVAYEGHACQWKGPSWPYATAVTLTALANVLNNYTQDAISKADYLKILKIYAKCHRRKRADGKVIPWLDENIDPFKGNWLARTMLIAQDAKRKAQGKKPGVHERGKEYNHSSYCDLVTVQALLDQRCFA